MYGVSRNLRAAPSIRSSEPGSAAQWLHDPAAITPRSGPATARSAPQPGAQPEITGSSGSIACHRRPASSAIKSSSGRLTFRSGSAVAEYRLESPDAVRWGRSFETQALHHRQVLVDHVRLFQILS